MSNTNVVIRRNPRIGFEEFWTGNGWAISPDHAELMSTEEARAVAAKVGGKAENAGRILDSDSWED